MEKLKASGNKYGLEPTVKHRFQVTVVVDPDNPKAVTFTQIEDALADASRWMDGVLHIEAYYRGTVAHMDSEDKPNGT